MAEDWLADVRKYDPDCDEETVAGIVRHCGIALRNRDSSLVSFSDPKELGRVRDSFLRKKLGLDHADDQLDAAIAAVGERMKDDRTKNRVTVYYLLSDAFDRHHLFRKGDGAKAVPTTSVSEEPSAAAVNDQTGAALAEPASVSDRPPSQPAAPAGVAPSGFGRREVSASADNDERFSSLGSTGTQSAASSSPARPELAGRIDEPARSGGRGWMWIGLIVLLIVLFLIWRVWFR